MTDKRLQAQAGGAERHAGSVDHASGTTYVISVSCLLTERPLFARSISAALTALSSRGFRFKRFLSLGGLDIFNADLLFLAGLNDFRCGWACSAAVQACPTCHAAADSLHAVVWIPLPSFNCLFFKVEHAANVFVLHRVAEW